MPLKGPNRRTGATGAFRRRTVSREIADRLAEEIARGRRKPGERLPSERDMSEEFDVGRSSVREAIKALESRGLVEGRHGEGTFVCGASVDALVQIPAAPVVVGEAEARHLFEVRDLLEPWIARRAALCAAPADVAALRHMLELQARLVESGRYTSDDDARFHLRLARTTGNPVLIRLLEGVMHLLGAVREPALRAASEAGLRVTLAGHWDIVLALEAHDPDAAEAATRRHLNNARATAVRVIRDAAVGGSV